jgi:hypothetical protein
MNRQEKTDSSFFEPVIIIFSRRAETEHRFSINGLIQQNMGDLRRHSNNGGNGAER